MKNQKGFIQIPLVIVIIVSIVIASTITTGVVLHKKGKLVSFIANISEVFKGKEPELKQERELKPTEEEMSQPEMSQEEISQQEQELEKAKLEAEKAKSENEKLKEEMEEAQQLAKEEQRRREETQRLNEEGARQEAEEKEKQTVGSISIKVNPAIIEADGKSEFTVEVVVKNIKGYAILNKKVIFKLFESSQEILSGNELTDAEGLAFKTYITGTTPGRRTITASVDDVSQSVYLKCLLEGTNAFEEYAEKVIKSYSPIRNDSTELWNECMLNVRTADRDSLSREDWLLPNEELARKLYDLTLCRQAVNKLQEAERVFNAISAPSVMEKYKEFRKKEIEYSLEFYNTAMEVFSRLNNNLNARADSFREQANYYNSLAIKEWERYSKQ